MSDKIKIGILGNADIARRMVIPALIETDLFELAGIASQSCSSQILINDYPKIPHFTNYDSLVESGLDAIYIPLPNSLHYKWIKESLENGIHVLAEKPMSCTLHQAREINHLARANKLVLLENFQFRFHSQLTFIKQKIDEGVIGEIRNVRAAFGVPPFSNKENIRYNKKLGGGALLDIGVYPLRVSQIFLGSKIYVDSAVLSKTDGYEVDIWGSAFLKQSDGRVTSQIAFGFDHFYQNSLELWGSLGQISADRIFTAGPGVQPRINIRANNISENLTLAQDNHFVNMLRHFFLLIQNLEGREIEYEQNVNQARLVDELREKAKF